MKKARWMVHYPGQFYANNLDFKRPVTKERAKQEAREWLGVKKLPPGTEVY